MSEEEFAALFAEACSSFEAAADEIREEILEASHAVGAADLDAVEAALACAEGMIEVLREQAETLGKGPPT